MHFQAVSIFIIYALITVTSQCLNLDSIIIRLCKSVYFIFLLYLVKLL